MMVEPHDDLIRRSYMRLPRSKLITKLIVFALVVYAGISLISLRGRIEAIRQEEHELRRAVAEMEVVNAQLEFNIDNHNEPEVIEEIARTDLGLVRGDEILFVDGGSGLNGSD